MIDVRVDSETGSQGEGGKRGGTPDIEDKIISRNGGKMDGEQMEGTGTAKCALAAVWKMGSVQPSSTKM